MKRLFSFFLALAMCATLSLALTACGDGDKNTYQSYLTSGKFSAEETLDEKHGEMHYETDNGAFVSDASLLKGSITFYGDKKSPKFGSSYYAEKSKSAATDGTDASYYHINISTSYQADTDILSVSVSGYLFRTVAEEKANGGFTWKDGVRVGFLEGKPAGLSFSFHLNKYLENKKITAADITVNSHFNTDSIRENMTWQGTPFTDRNPDWETDAIERTIDAVNEMLAKADAYLAANPR